MGIYERYYTIVILLMSRFQYLLMPFYLGFNWYNNVQWILNNYLLWNCLKMKNSIPNLNWYSLILTKTKFIFALLKLIRTYYWCKVVLQMASIHRSYQPLVSSNVFPWPGPTYCNVLKWIFELFLCHL